MSPYRPLHTTREQESRGPEHDDRVLAVLMIVLGLARLVPAIATAEAFGTEATVAAIMLAGGLAILVPIRGVAGRLWRRRVRIKR